MALSRKLTNLDELVNCGRIGGRVPRCVEADRGDTEGVAKAFRAGLRSLDAGVPRQLGDVPGRGRPRNRLEPIPGFCLTGWLP